MKEVPGLFPVALAIVAGALTLKGAAPDAPPTPAEPVVQLPAYAVVESPIARVATADAFASTSTTVDDAQLRDLAALDFADALRRTPGVTISRYNQVGSFGGGEGGAIFVRGMGSSRPGGEIKTMIDGVPILNGIFNHPLLDLMSMDLAAKIDVHGRATPLAFGNTLAVINVTTPRVEHPGEIGHAELAAGSFGTLVERFEQGANTGGFDYYVSQSYRRSDGDRPDSNGRLENYFLRLGWAFSPRWQASYVLNRTVNRSTDPGIEDASLGPPSTRGETYATADWLHIATLAYHDSTTAGSLKAYLNDGEGNWIRRQFSGNSDSLNDWRLYGVRWSETLHLWEGGEIAAGADLDYDQGTSRSVPVAPATETVFGPATMRLFSAYAGISQAVTVADGAKLVPSAGARFYDHNRFGSRWAPQAGLTLTAGRTQWHAGWNRAVNHPGLEVAALSSSIAIPALGESWQALRPEIADQFEVGVRQEFGERSAATLTVFGNRIQNRYVIAFPPPPPPRYVNISSERTEGVEATVEMSPTKGLGVFTCVSLLRSTPGDLPYAPHSTFSGGLNWQLFSNWMLSADSVYISSMHILSQGRSVGATNPAVVGAHFLLNARLARRFTLGNRAGTHGEVFLAGENLTDRRFAYRPGYPIPGLNGMVGIRLNW
jgi:iron complex outermembrane receptor protein